LIVREYTPQGPYKYRIIYSSYKGEWLKLSEEDRHSLTPPEYIKTLRNVDFAAWAGLNQRFLLEKDHIYKFSILDDQCIEKRHIQGSMNTTILIATNNYVNEYNSEIEMGFDPRSIPEFIYPTYIELNRTIINNNEYSLYNSIFSRRGGKRRKRKTRK
jgi:hypothetical protein